MTTHQWSPPAGRPGYEDGHTPVYDPDDRVNPFPTWFVLVVWTWTPLFWAFNVITGRMALALVLGSFFMGALVSAVLRRRRQRRYYQTA